MEEEKEGGKENGHLVTKCERERKWEGGRSPAERQGLD